MRNWGLRPPPLGCIISPIWYWLCGIFWYLFTVWVLRLGWEDAIVLLLAAGLGVITIYVLIVWIGG